MEEQNKEAQKDSYPEHEVQMKTLFGKLTEIILGSVRTGRDGLNLMIAVGQWASLMVASILVVIEKDQGKSFLMIDRFTSSFNKDVKAHLIMLRGLQKKSGVEEKRIITRDDLQGA